jgi:hypothetical protein
MKAAVKSAYSSDADLDAPSGSHQSVDIASLQLEVGAAGSRGADIFEVIVVTPDWVRRAVKDSGPLVGRHYLVMDPFDIHEALAFITRKIEALEGETWDELSDRISRFGHWEFEDYKPFVRR